MTQSSYLRRFKPVALLFSVVWGLLGAAPAICEAQQGTAVVDLPAGNEAAGQPDMRKMSYALGVSIGRDLSNAGLPLDGQMLSTGLLDAINKGEIKLNEEEFGQQMALFEQLMRRQMTQQSSQVATRNRKIAGQFLADNREKEGVVETKSGLQYVILKAGTGGSPAATDRVRTHYRGTLIDGTEFDSSYRRNQPAEFPVGGVIKGWVEALQKMKVGGKWKLFVPADLAYGDNPPGPPIEPGSMLIFEVELLDILP